ncbi:MAG: 2-oxoacid:acceptor oxidoreductase subunit alpha [Candidatus Methanofastidiosia archaeon]
MKDIVFRIGGESGEGIVTLGELFTLALVNAGMEVFTFRTYPSEIKGGPVMYQVRVSDEELLSQGDRVDVLLALNEEAYDTHIQDLRKNGVLIYDSGRFNISFEGTAYGIPLEKCTRKEVGFQKSKNVLILGILSRLFEIPSKIMEEVVRRKLGRKPELLQKNLMALKAGLNYCGREISKKDNFLIRSRRRKKIRLSGNQAISLGALVSGLKLYVGYPITPATDILEFMAKYLPSFGGKVVQSEDEISAICMALGASFTGVKVMIATSGPGFSLMTEVLGLSSMAEIPLVIVNSQRGGPSTGMPTKTEQGDLSHSLFGGHGDFPRIVLAPLDVEDCFYLTIKAFNLSEKYQLPVILLSDQSLSHRIQTLKKPSLSQIQILNRRIPREDELKNFRRYKLTESGVSPISSPMQKGAYVATGMEHNEFGEPDLSPKTHREMMRKRFRKLNITEKEELFEVWGSKNPKLGIISWGSTSGASREACERLVSKGYKVGCFFPKILNPLPDRALREFLLCDKVVVCESNYEGQLANLLSSRFRVEIVRFRKYEGIPATPKEIYDFACGMI